jgi:hypothetical protein
MTSTVNDSDRPTREQVIAFCKKIGISYDRLKKGKLTEEEKAKFYAYHPKPERS